MEPLKWIIDVKHLSKAFKKRPAVLDVSLQVQRGEIFGFLGPNGAGKTTTLRMLCGLLTPDKGEGHCLGFNILKETEQAKAFVGYKTQYFSLYNDLTIYENLDFRARLYGIINRKEQIENAMERLHLTQRQHQIAGTLSGGWQQRLLLAAAIIHNPLLLLLDEPTTGIDASARRDFWELINDLSAEGVTILMSSHNMDEVERCHRIGYLSYGKIILTGTIKEIIKKIGLTTWEVYGPNLPLLREQLKATPGVDQVISHYNKLHVSAKNAEQLKQAISPFSSNPKFTWNVIDTYLEDVFVYLVSQTTDSRIKQDLL